MFSVGLLYSCRDFLSLNAEIGMSPDAFKRYFISFKYSTAEQILEVSFKCGWAKVTQEGNMKLTDRGKIISQLDYKSALMYQLEDMILNYSPQWASILTKGRTEAKCFLPQDVCQCFREAGLFGEISDSLIEFWDRLALAYRNYTNKKMLEIGRTGERLSFDYEFNRTGKIPLWQAIESNISGFDLLSVLDSSSNQKLQIEVKASTSDHEYAKIHISKHEWNTAVSSLNYVFHLWNLWKMPTLNVVTVKKMSDHIPYNNGEGEWESVEIPFKVLI